MTNNGDPDTSNKYENHASHITGLLPAWKLIIQLMPTWVLHFLNATQLETYPLTHRFSNKSPHKTPTEVSHLAVVVGLSTYDPKDF